MKMKNGVAALLSFTVSFSEHITSPHDSPTATQTKREVRRKK
jgi:hypothetical protein